MYALCGVLLTLADCLSRSCGEVVGATSSEGFPAGEDGETECVCVRQMNGYLVVRYDMGNAPEEIIEFLRGSRHTTLHDGQYHYVTIIRNENKLSVQLDDQPLQHRTHGR